MIKAVRGLRSLAPSIDLLMSSPFRRAVETAQVISDSYGGMPFTQRGELAPDVGTDHVIDWLASQRKDSVLCVVGHEPDLGELLKALIADPSQAPAALKKGSATLVRFAGPVAASSGTMQWHHTAKDLASRV
jgi:phosphohistidine phosphatase